MGQGNGRGLGEEDREAPRMQLVSLARLLTSA